MRAATYRGFTLIELLVALAIFAVMSTLAYGGLRHILSLDSGLLVASTRHQGLQTAVSIIEQDLEQAAARSVRDELGDAEPALRAGLAGDTLVLTRATPGVPESMQRTVLSRVRYRFVDGALFRDVFSDLDCTPESSYRSRRLLEGLSNFSLRFFADRSWSEFWPRVGDQEFPDRLPQGVEFIIEFAPELEIRRLVARTE